MFAGAAAIACAGLVVGVVPDSAATGSANPTCPAVAGKMPSTPAAICGHDLLQTGPGGQDIVSLPPGSHPCPSVAGKRPSSPTASCTAGPANNGAGSSEVLSVPAGMSPCPSLPGKPSSSTSGCRGDATTP